MIDMRKWKSGIRKWKILFCSNFFYLNSKWRDIKSQWFDKFFFFLKNKVKSVVKCEKMWGDLGEVVEQGLNYQRWWERKFPTIYVLGIHTISYFVLNQFILKTALKLLKVRKNIKSSSSWSICTSLYWGTRGL
jgi:hypothetical protein